MDLHDQFREKFENVVKTFYNDSPIIKDIKHVIIKFFSKKYKVLQAVYDKARWIVIELLTYVPNTGLFKGHIDLWKLQTAIHLNNNDLLCAIWCCV